MGKPNPDGVHTVWHVLWSITGDDRDVMSRCVTIEGYTTLGDLGRMIAIKHGLAERVVKIKTIMRVDHEG